MNTYSENLSHISEPDLAWLAGIIEGEGSMLPRRNRLRGGVVTVAMTDEDTVQRLKEVTQLGHVYGPYKYKKKPRSKPYWTWKVQKSADVRALVLRLLPWFGERRTDQALDCLAHIGAVVNHANPEAVCRSQNASVKN